MQEDNMHLVSSEKEIEEVVQQVERLEPEQRATVLQKLEIYQGDLPHPSILEGYNALYPEAAKKIIDNGIAESEYRREQERKFLSAQIAERKRGQYLGFTLALLIIICGSYMILNGNTVAGSVLSGITAIGIIGLFTGNGKK